MPLPESYTKPMTLSIGEDARAALDRICIERAKIRPAGQRPPSRSEVVRELIFREDTRLSGKRPKKSRKNSRKAS